MKSVVSTLLAILLILVAFTVDTSSLVSANIDTYYPPTLTILSPTQNETYGSNVPLTLNLTLTPKLIGWEKPTTLSYSLDEKTVVALELPDNAPSSNTYFSHLLSGLGDGVHSLSVQGSTDWGNQFNSTVTFKVASSLQASDNNPPKVSVVFPENKSYLSNGQLKLNFSVNEPFLWARYSIDNEANVTVLGNQTIFPFVSPGAHSLTVYAVDTWGNTGSSDTAYFYTVFISEENLPLPINPVVSVISPLNESLSEDTIPLTFTLNMLISLDSSMPPTFPDISWVGYSLDSQNNVTITGNTTLPSLTSGDHNITVYAKDTCGNTGMSQTIFFTINPPSFPTAAVIAGASTLIIISAVSVVYFSKRKGVSSERLHH